MFSISGDQLALTTSPDYETNTTLSTCVRITNSAGETLDNPLNFGVNNPYALNYHGNGHASGTAPTSSETYAPTSTATVASLGSLARTGHTFNGWNTLANGTGTNYAPGSSLTMNNDITLYAQWLDVPPETPTTPPSLPSASDSGTSDSDGITNVNAPTLILNCTETGGQVTIYVDGVAHTTANCDSFGPIDVHSLASPS